MSNTKKSTNSKASNGIAKGSGSFISFSAVAGNSTTSRDYSILEKSHEAKDNPIASFSKFEEVILLPLYTGSNNDFSVIAKKLLKKDTVTKLKALQDMESMLKSNEFNIEEVPDIITYFIFVYNKYVYDNQRNIRLKINEILQLLLERNKVAFTRYMKQLIGAWLFAMSDIVQEISLLATNAFISAIPAKKRREFLLLQFSQDILNYILLNQSKSVESYRDKTSNESSPNDDSEECYERIVVTSLNSLCKLLTSISPDGRITLFAENSSNSSICDSNMKLWNKIQEKVWGFTTSKIISIRKASYEILMVMTKEVPNTLDIYTNPTIPPKTTEIGDVSLSTSVKPDGNNSNSSTINNQQKKNSKYAIMLVKILSESEISLLPSAVQTFITYITKDPSLWGHIPLKKVFLSRLKDLILTSSTTILPCLLPLIGAIPITMASLRGSGIEPLLDFIDFLSISLHKNQLAESVIPVTYVAIAEISTVLLLRSSISNDKDSSQGNNKILTDVNYEKEISDDATTRRINTLCKHITNSLICLLTNYAGYASSKKMSTVLPDVTRILVQLHQATVAQKVLTSPQWSSAVWEPFTLLVISLLQTQAAAIDLTRRRVAGSTAIASTTTTTTFSDYETIPESHSAITKLSDTAVIVEQYIELPVDSITQYDAVWNKVSDVTFDVVYTLKQALRKVELNTDKKQSRFDINSDTRCTTSQTTSTSTTTTTAAVPIEEAGLIVVLRGIVRECVTVMTNYKYHQDVISDPSVTSKDMLYSSCFLPLHAAYVTSIILMDLPVHLMHQLLSESYDREGSKGIGYSHSQLDKPETKRDRADVAVVLSQSCLVAALTDNWIRGLAVILRLSEQQFSVENFFLEVATESIFRLLLLLHSVSDTDYTAFVITRITDVVYPLLTCDCVIGITLFFRSGLYTIFPDNYKLYSSCCELVDKMIGESVHRLNNLESVLKIDIEFLSSVILLQYDIRSKEMEIGAMDGCNRGSDKIDQKLLKWYETSQAVTPLFALLTVYGHYRHLDKSYEKLDILTGNTSDEIDREIKQGISVTATTTSTASSYDKEKSSYIAAAAALPTSTSTDICTDFNTMLPLLLDSLFLGSMSHHCSSTSHVQAAAATVATKTTGSSTSRSLRHGMLTRIRSGSFSASNNMTVYTNWYYVRRNIILYLPAKDFELFINTASYTLGDILSDHYKTSKDLSSRKDSGAIVQVKIEVAASIWAKTFLELLQVDFSHYDKISNSSTEAGSGVGSVTTSHMSFLCNSTRITSPELWRSFRHTSKFTDKHIDFDLFLFDVLAELINKTTDESNDRRIWLPILSDISLLIEVMSSVKAVQKRYATVGRYPEATSGSSRELQPEANREIETQLKHVQTIEQYCRNLIASASNRVFLIITLFHILFNLILDHKTGGAEAVAVTEVAEAVVVDNRGSYVNTKDATDASDSHLLEAIVMDFLTMIIERNEPTVSTSNEKSAFNRKTSSSNSSNSNSNSSHLKHLNKTRTRLPVHFLLHSDSPAVKSKVWVVQAVPESTPVLTVGGSSKVGVEVERLRLIPGIVDSITRLTAPSHTTSSRGTSSNNSSSSSAVMIQVSLIMPSDDNTTTTTSTSATSVDGSRLLVAEPSQSHDSGDLIEVDEPPLPATGSLFASMSLATRSYSNYQSTATSTSSIEFTIEDLFVWLVDVVANLESLFRSHSNNKHEKQLLRLTEIISHMLQTIFKPSRLFQTDNAASATYHSPSSTQLLIARLRGMTLRLLSGDLIAKPNKVCCGLHLFRVMLQLNKCLGGGLWLGKAMTSVRNHYQSLRAGMRLLLRQEEIRTIAHELCKTQIALLDAVDCASLVEGGESLVSLVLSFLTAQVGTDNIHRSSEEDLLSLACIELLRALWELQQDPNLLIDTTLKKGRNSYSSSKSSKEPSPIQNVKTKSAAERRVSIQEGGWESVGLKYVIQSLLCLGRGTHSLRHAIHFSLLHRSRKEANELVVAACVETLEDKLLDIVLDADAVFGDRIVAVKLLDVCYTNRSSNSTKLVLPERATEEDNANFFEAIVGKKLFRFLNLQYNQHHLTGNDNDRIAKEEENDNNKIININSNSKGDGCGYGEARQELIEDDICDTSSSDSEELEDYEKEERKTTNYNNNKSLRVSPSFSSSSQTFTDIEDDVGICLVWLLCLQRICSSGRDENGIEYRLHLGDWLKSSALVSNILSSLIAMAPDIHRYRDLENYLQKVKPHSDDHYDISKLASYALFRNVCELPAVSRAWWSDLSRCPKNNFMKFVADSVAIALIRREVAAAAEATSQGLWDSDELVVSASVVSREVVARYLKEEAKIELRVILPSSYPLENAVVESSSRVGIAEGRGDRWKLQISQRLASENGSIVDAILMWKRNVDSELEGVEPCPICFSTLHAKHLSIPSLRCRTCKNKFHNQCLYHWFETSGKSKCVICQEPFVAS